MTLDDSWRDLPLREKQALRDRLALARARVGLPSLGATKTPGEMAIELDPRGTVQRPHLEAIDHALRDVLDMPDSALMIFTPPQVGKSSRVSRWFPFWWLTHRPADQILLASYAATLASGHGRAARDYVRDYGRNYGLVLNPDESAAADWALLSGGGMRSRGVRGGLTGQPADLLLIDDPVADRQQADSPTTRSAVWEWYSGTFQSRRQPGTREILTMTRWHPDDLAGRLLARDGRVEEGGRWTVLHMPAIAVPEDHVRGFYKDPLGRKPGEPLSHPKIAPTDSAGLAKHWARQKATALIRDWDALYQGSPFKSEGALLTEDMIRTRRGTPPDARRAGVGVDPSGGGRDTAGIVGGIFGEDGRMWFVADDSAVMPSTKWPDMAVLMNDRIDGDCIVVETNYGGDQATTLVRHAFKHAQEAGHIDKSKLCPRIISVHSRKKKALRAEPVVQALMMDHVRFGPNLRDLENEWTQWEPGSTWSPGALDASVHLAYELLPKVSGSTQVQSPNSGSRAGAPSAMASRRR